jgi:hypothetical protein
MSSLALHVGAMVLCPHQGLATDISLNVRVKASNMAVASVADQFVIAGCIFTVGTKPQPCVTIRWLAPALRVKINGSPALLQNSRGLCQSAEQAPQGPPQATPTQLRVKGT